jgi:hypothetical protein
VAVAGAAADQSRIGWDNLLFGRLATKWMALQSDSSERWAADMVYRLFQLSHSLWMARSEILYERDAQRQLLQVV